MLPLDVLLPLVILNVLLAWSLWFPIAAGQFSMVVPLFAGVGGYSAALISLHVTDSPIAALLSAMLLAAVAAVPFGLLGARLRSFGLAIATLGAVIIAQTIYQNVPVLGGAIGLYGAPVHEIVLPGLLVVGVVGLFLWSVLRGRLGRILFTLQYDEPLTSALGVSALAVKVYVLVVSGAIGGADGALTVMYTGFVDPSQFGAALITQLFAFVICGGMTSMWGPAVGAAALTILLQNLSVAGAWRQIIFGALLAVVVIARPDGLTVRSSALSARRLRRALRAVPTPASGSADAARQPSDVH